MTSATASEPRILTDKSSASHNLDAGAGPANAYTASRWQTALQEAISDPAELLATLELGEEWLPGAQQAARLFPLRVPRSYVRRMRKSDPHDPLLRQVLPLHDECLPARGFTSDAVGDMASLRAPGLLQKYNGRALLITTGACGVHCRFCFRRAFPYGDQLAARRDWQESLALIAADNSIEEVILSGGDPLSLTDDKLAALAERLEAIPHLQRLRIHTRQPVVLPERVDDGLLGWLGRGRLQKIVVLHCNHAQELDRETRAAVARLAGSGVILLNQAVLLKNVNDSLEALKNLSQELFRINILPYYLHLLDRVQGAAHFEVDEARAKALMRQLAAELPGYMLPRLVREEMGEPNKTNVSW